MCFFPDNPIQQFIYTDQMWYNTGKEKWRRILGYFIFNHVIFVYILFHISIYQYIRGKFGENKIVLSKDVVLVVQYWKEIVSLRCLLDRKMQISERQDEQQSLNFHGERYSANNLIWEVSGWKIVSFSSPVGTCWPFHLTECSWRKVLRIEYWKIQYWVIF